MSEQRHVIKRQVIELTVQGSAQAASLQDELSRVYRQRIIPLIDRRCTELSDPDRLYRLDTLDLDLGALNWRNFEEDFVAKVDAALSRELSRQIQAEEVAAGQRGSSSKAQSQLELFALFARTGSLPWWADASRLGLLSENLEQLLGIAAGALARLLQELAREPDPRRRLIRHYTDEQLIALCGLLVPEYEAALTRDFRELLAGLQAIQAAGQPARIRQVLWNNVLLVTGSGGQEFASLDAFYRAILIRVSAELGRINEIGLLKEILQASQSGRVTTNSRLLEILSGLSGPGLERQALPASQSPLAVRLAQLQAAGGPLSAAWGGLISRFAQLPVAFQTRLLAALNELPAEASSQSIAGRMLYLLQTGGGIEMPDVLQLFRAVAGDSAVSDLSIVNRAPEKAVDLSFSETDELPVGNSGLVILWPFLGNFFTRLGLQNEERRFKDEAARQRAAGLLQMLATGEASPPEYLLPLNKVLCGLGLTDVFDFGLPLLESEAQECADLLEALIAQAPILRDMTPDGLRGSFLLRPGVLSASDGMWLLRVERQTYDIILERFPWSWEWVKLPWMDAPLRVEW